jgi:hypothetical protein
MGKIKQGILGGFRGKVGTVIGSSWNGIAYMRGQAQSVRNANTEAQQAQRAFFKQVQELTSQLSAEQLAMLFPTVTRGMTRRNMLTRQLSTCYDYNSDVKVFDLSLLEGIGNGERISSPMLIIEVSTFGQSNEKTGMVFNQSDVAAIAKPESACFSVVAYNLTQKKIAVFNTPQSASDISLTVETGGFAAEGDTVRCYLSYQYPTRTGYGTLAIANRPERAKEKKK